MLGDFSVTFEHCNFSEFIQTFANLASLDYGAIAERVTSLAVEIGLNY